MKPLKHKFSTLLFLLLICIVSGNTTATPYTLKLPYKEITISKKGDKTIFQGVSLTGEAGAPALPHYSVSFLVAADFDEKNISATIKNMENQILSGTHLIDGILPATFDGTIIWPSDKNIIDGKDQDIYSKDAFYPSNVIQSVSSGNFLGQKIVKVTLYPYQYNPVTQKVRKLTSGELHVSAPTLQAGSFSPAPILNESQRQLLNNMVVNPQQTALHAPITRASANVKSDYYIITTNDIVRQSTELEKFVAFRNENYNVHLITETQWGGGIGNTAAENIRAWIADNINHSFSHILLIGNPDPVKGDVPMKMTEPKPDFNAPTDFYYANTIGDWDTNNNGKYGEFGLDHVSTYPDYFVGRIPFYSSWDSLGHKGLDAVLKKIIKYETADPSQVSWRKDALLPMEPLDEVTHEFFFGEHIKDNVLPSADWDFTRVYDTYNEYSQEEIPYVTELVPPVEITPCNEDNVLSAWKRTRPGLVVWGTHGDQEEAVDVFNVDAVKELNDNYPAVTVQVSCLNSYPENPRNLSYSLLRNGAIASISATRESYYSQGGFTYNDAQTNHGMSAIATKNFLKYDSYTLGMALAASKSSATYNTPGFWANLMVISLYGDPALRFTPLGYQTTELTVGRNSTYATISEALAVVATMNITTPVTILVEPGYYYEEFSLGDISTTAYRNITIKSTTGKREDVVFCSSDPSNRNSILRLSNAENIYFKDITFWFTSRETECAVVTLQNECRNITFDNCHIKGNNNGGYQGYSVKFSNATAERIQFINNTFIERSSSAIFADQHSNLNNILVEDATLEGLHFGVLFHGNSEYVRILKSNVRALNEAIHIDNGVTTKLHANNIYSGFVGIRLDDYRSASVINNFVYAATNGLEAAGNGITILHNTITTLGRNRTNAALKLDTDNYDHIKNNNLSNFGKGVALRLVTETPKPVLMGNNYYSALATEPTHGSYDDAHIVQFGDRLFKTRSDWSFALDNSISVDPQFENSKDYRYRNRALDNRGVSLAQVHHDIENAPRDNAPSIGCFEPLNTPFFEETFDHYSSSYISQSNWEFYVNSEATAEAWIFDEFSPGNKICHVYISDRGDEQWHVHLRRGSFTLEEGKEYEISFRARTESGKKRTIDVKCEQNGGSWKDYSRRGKFSIDGRMRFFRKTFTMTYPTDNDVYFVIDMGKMGVYEDQLDVIIDDLRVREK